MTCRAVASVIAVATWGGRILSVHGVHRLRGEGHRQRPGLGEGTLKVSLIVTQCAFHLPHTDVPSADQCLGVQLAHRRPDVDAVVHRRLSDGWVIDLAVPVAPVADQIDDDVLVERLTIVEGQACDPDNGLGVVSVDVEDRGLDRPCHVGGVCARTAAGG